VRRLAFVHHSPAESGTRVKASFQIPTPEDAASAGATALMKFLCRAFNKGAILGEKITCTWEFRQGYGCLKSVTGGKNSAQISGEVFL
jgi:hypothetical protein